MPWFSGTWTRGRRCGRRARGGAPARAISCAGCRGPYEGAYLVDGLRQILQPQDLGTGVHEERPCVDELIPVRVEDLAPLAGQRRPLGRRGPTSMGAHWVSGAGVWGVMARGADEERVLRGRVTPLQEPTEEREAAVAVVENMVSTAVFGERCVHTMRR